MGIQHLWRDLQPYGVDVAVPRLHEHVESLASCSTSSSKQVIVGIDISLWIVHGCNVKEVSDGVLRTIFYRLCRLLKLPSLQPVFVFDGPQRPEFKRGKLHQVAAWTESKVERYANRIKELIVAFGFTYIQAPGEAEAELGNLCRHGKIDAVLSDDADCFAFGATTVIRNWGSNLIGSKARSAHLQRGNREQTPSTASSASDSDSGTADPQVLDFEVLRKHDNLATVFSTKDLPDGVDADGCILVALLSGGDYDPNGVQRCGEKTALAMARAGFGKKLVEGARKHLSVAPPVHNQYHRSSPPPSQGKQWKSFLTSWREDLLLELRTDRSGHLGRKQAKLAGSEAMRTFLDSDDSLRLLSSYVSPVITTPPGSAAIENQRPPDVQRIAALASVMFQWGPEKTLDALRNRLWLGCLFQHHSGRIIVSLNADMEIQGKCKSKDAASLQSFWANSNLCRDSAGFVKAIDGVEALIVLNERVDPRTGGLKEVRVEFQVVGLVADAEAGIASSENDAVLQTMRRQADKPSTPFSSQATAESSTPSPRKKKAFTDPREPLREWIAMSVIENSEQGRQAIEAFRKLKAQKEVEKVRKEQKRSPIKNQRTLNAFFKGTVAKPSLGVGNKPGAKAIADNVSKDDSVNVVKDAKLSPSKRLARSSPRSSIEKVTGPSAQKTSENREKTSRKPSTKRAVKKLARPTSPSPIKGGALTLEPGHITISDDSDSDDGDDQPVFVRAARAEG